MNLQTFFTNLATFINGPVLTFLLALAFFFFIWNTAQYFIMGSTLAGDEKKGTVSGRVRARRYAMYGILAFVVILSLAGIVNLFVDSFGFTDGQPLQPDYLQSGGAGGAGGGGWDNYGYVDGPDTDINPDP